MRTSTEKRYWLEDAICLEVHRSKSSRLRRLVDYLFDEITPLIKVSSKSRQKTVLKTILLSLYQAREVNKPVRYSRNKNHYTRNRRYGQLFFKFDRIIPIIDALEHLDYVEQKSGFYIQDQEDGRQTRMWGTDNLWRLFTDFGLHQPVFFKPDAPGGDEEVILRNDKKQHVAYSDNPTIQQMRRDLKRYNDFIRKHKVTLRLDGDVVVDYRFLVNDVFQNIRKGNVWIKSVQYTPGSRLERNDPLPVPTFTAHNIEFNYNPAHIISSILDTTVQYSTTMTNTNRRISKLRLLLRRFLSDEHRFEKFISDRSFDLARIPFERRQRILNKDFQFRDIGIESLEIVLDSEQLYRVFNRKSWNLGGRAYGALHQDFVRKHMRPFILIDGQPTIEIDFSSYHILMLYHRECINYQYDPYSVCEGPEMRDIYKAVALVAINAKDLRSAYGAIREELKSRGISLPPRKEPLKSLVETFRKTHRPIEHYLFSDIGLTLQNIDGNIMNAILVRLLDHGILGLSVYDSVIVPTQHEDLLRDIMIEEYQRIMGFPPRL
jgi:hypothetical protein